MTKWLIAAMLMLFIGCSTGLEKMHAKAKMSKNHRHCYVILLPSEIDGYWCVEYHPFTKKELAR